MTAQLDRLPPLIRRHGPVAAVCLLAGSFVASKGLSPTGSTPVDAVIVTVGAALWTLSATTGRVELFIGVTVGAAALTASLWTLPVALATIVLAMAWRRLPVGTTWQRALLAGGLAQVLAQIRPLGAFGVSTAVALTAAAVVSRLAWRAHTDAARRMLRRAMVGAGGAALILVVGFVVTAAIAGRPLVQGGREARASLRLIDQGEVDAAIAGFSQAADRLSRASDSLDAWWGAPARAVPLVAQQQRSVRRLAHEASAAATEIADILRSTDYDALGVEGGRIDLDAIRALDAPLQDLDTALDALESGSELARADWLLPPINNLINTLSDDVIKRRAQIVDMREAVRRAPDMLGASGPRTYFVALTTPAEARGLGGLMGNWAEITIDDGRLALTGFGRHGDLLSAAPATPRLTQLSNEYLSQYGAYVLSDPDTGTVGPGVWTNLTVSAHFPWVAETIAELYPQSGGKELDGVFVMDVFAIAQLMRITGAVSVTDLGIDITPDNALQYLLRDQYLVELDDRVDLLETLARTTIDRSLSGALPSPPKLAALMSPMARQHRLAAWARRPEEQAVFRNANMTKELLPEPDDHLIGYSLYNGNGNKIDAYLEGDAEVDLDVDVRAGTAAGKLWLNLRNTAPASGLPDYVIGNLVGLPRGTNRIIVTVYSTSPIVEMYDEAGAASWVPGTERGLYTAAMTLEIPPGGMATVTAKTQGDWAGDLQQSIVVDTPPSAVPFPLVVRRNGEVLTDAPIVESGTHRFLQ